jgi:hypothetical protein
MRKGNVHAPHTTPAGGPEMDPGMRIRACFLSRTRLQALVQYFPQMQRLCRSRARMSIQTGFLFRLYEDAYVHMLAEEA